jgi:uncharacterized protein YxeA
MIWREKRILLIILGLILLANAVFFFTYRVQYQSRLDALDDRQAQVQGELDQAHLARLRAEQTFQSYRKVENEVLTVFDEHWSTQQQRFTKLFAEVTRLAMASSLTPESYSFRKGDAKRVSSGSKRETLGATEVGISFGVVINLLELSHQFVIIEGITLNSADGQALSLNLELKTIFRDEQTDVASKPL